MRLMQQSGHIGKIVLSPPRPGEIGILPRGVFAPAAEKTHLITGGCGGFGLAAARWLAAHGARHLVLAGRSGAGSSEAQEAIGDVKSSGINIQVEALDVANACEVEALFKKIAQS